MMKTMKTMVTLLGALLVCLACVGCSSAPDLANDVATLTVARAALDAVDSAQDYMDGTSAYFAYYFGDLEQAVLVNDCVMMFHQNETNVNQLCIFRTASEKDARSLEDAVEDYIEEQAEYLYGFAKNYSPEDLKKIDNADTEVIGCYVIGYILSPAQEQTALKAVREALSAR